MREYQAFTFTGEHMYRDAALAQALMRYAAWLTAQDGEGADPTIFVDTATMRPVVHEFPPILTSYRVGEDTGWDCVLPVIAFMRQPARAVGEGPTDAEPA